MEEVWLFALFSILLVAVALLGAYLPRSREMSEESIHHLIALSVGLFLGLLLFILLPEGLEESDEGGISAPFAMMVMALGFIVVMLVESYIGHDGAHSHELEHEVKSASLYVGLGIHAACDGIVLAALFMAGEAVGLAATIGLCIHKFADLFSLSSATLLTDSDNKRAMKHLSIFALITPVVGLICFGLFSSLDVEGLLGIPLMFAAGTMLYVTTCDILPECFHDGKDAKTVGMIILGIVLMAVFFVLFPEAH